MFLLVSYFEKYSIESVDMIVLHIAIRDLVKWVTDRYIPMKISWLSSTRIWCYHEVYDNIIQPVCIKRFVSFVKIFKIPINAQNKNSCSMNMKTVCEHTSIQKLVSHIEFSHYKPHLQFLRIRLIITKKYVTSYSSSLYYINFLKHVK